ncbi:DUF456 domain-containing protein [Nocardioides deserti]|uniref:DUF456 domain-containing protein n=1 Tax=Nocardioides deserti TaxID=1588644 RepID=A0ABR6U3C7_9ACTN|nr:DUF456 domain-containing protein [Nocardioides deserti]MBC2958880.1 DUF456 domain-containing protein [Nocardioides deserti]GGO69377.1 hypothetical protein GCM10012276_05430 [Nocardioides deserti]
MSLLEVLVAVAIAIGIVGVLVPVLPGTLLVLAAVLVWAVDVGGSTAWTVFAVATVVLALGAVVKYAVPGRRLQDAGIPSSTLVVGGVLGFVGFFVVPVAGLLLGFVLGVYLAEHRRLGARAAWPSTVHALKAAGLSILIELLAALLAAATWTVGVVVT